MTFRTCLSALGLALLTVGCASASKTWKSNTAVVMPECSVAYSVQTEGTAFSNQFSNQGLASTMVVYTPLGEQKKTFQEIADTSCARLSKKISALGYAVLTGAALREKSETYRGLHKDNFTGDPDQRELLMAFGSSETGVPKGGRGWTVNMGYGSMSREGHGIVVLPEFQVAFGTVKGGGSSHTEQAAGVTTYSTQAKYNPEVVVKRESNMDWFGGDTMGHFKLAEERKSDAVPWLVNLKQGDTKTNAISAIGNVLLGSRKEQATYFTMDVDAAKMKEAILAQLDKAENDFVAQLKETRGE